MKKSMREDEISEDRNNVQGEGKAGRGNKTPSHLFLVTDSEKTDAIGAALDGQKIDRDGPPNSGPEKIDVGEPLRILDALDIEARLDEIAARLSGLPERQRARMLRLIEAAKRGERRAQREQARISTRGR